MNHNKLWRKITFEDKTVIVKAENPTKVVARLAKKKNKNRKGNYYLSGGTVVYHKISTLGHFRVETYEDKECTKRVVIK